MEVNRESQYLLANGVKSRETGNAYERGTSTSSSNPSIWRDTNRTQKIFLFYAAASTASIYFCLGIPIVFFSRVVVSKGGDKLYAAAILTSTYLFASMASLLCGKYQSKIPTKTFIWSGLLTMAITQGCLGCLEYVDNILAFLLVGFVLKAVQGIGQGFISVALLSLLWHEIPEHVEKSFGITRSMTGAGFLLSSFTSGYLYSIQNAMMIPCVASSMVPLLLSFVGWLILPDIENVEQGKDYHAWRYFCNPKSVFVMGLAATCGATFAVYSGSFTSYAQSIGVSVINVGIIFAAAEATVMFVSLIAGYFANTNHTCRQISLAIGFLGMLAVNLTFSPTNEMLSILHVQVVIFVVTASGVRTLAFPEMIHQSLRDNADLKNNFSFRCQLSGVWYFALLIPAFVFSVAGTALQNLVSYSWSQTISGLTGLFLTIVSSAAVYLRNCHSQPSGT